METFVIKHEPVAVDVLNDILSVTFVPDTSVIKKENAPFTTHDDLLIKQESLDTKQESLNPKQEFIDNSSIDQDKFDEKHLADSNKILTNQKLLVIADGRESNRFSEYYSEGADTIAKPSSSCKYKCIHIKTHHKVEEINLCPICGFDNQNNAARLTVHMWEEHGREEFSSYPANYRDKGSRKAMSNSVLNLSNRKLPTSHKNGLDAKKYMPMSSVYVEKGKQYPCSICNISFQQLSTLINHMEKHTGVNKKCCVVCRKRMETNDALTKHMKTHTQEELQFIHNEDAEKKTCPCSKCGRHFQESDASHNYIHTPWPLTKKQKYKKIGTHNEDLKLCPTCIINQFTTASRHDSHVQKSKADNHLCTKYCLTCPICGVKIQFKGPCVGPPVCQRAFEAHMQSHQADNVKKGMNCPVCPICGVKVQFRGVLEAHMKSHKADDVEKGMKQ